MNQYLYNYLGTQGFTQPCLAERVRQYLIARIVALGGTADTYATEDDLWKQYGSLAGATATTVNEIQIQWAVLIAGSTGTTWNDVMRNLP